MYKTGLRAPSNSKYKDIMHSKCIDKTDRRVSWFGGKKKARIRDGVRLRVAARFVDQQHCWLLSCLHGWLHGLLHDRLRSWLDSWLHIWLNGWLHSWLYSWRYGESITKNAHGSRIPKKNTKSGSPDVEKHIIISYWSNVNTTSTLHSML